MKLEMQKLKDEIKAKNEQIALLEKKIADLLIVSPTKLDQMEISQVSFDFLIMQICIAIPRKNILMLEYYKDYCWFWSLCIMICVMFLFNST